MNSVAGLSPNLRIIHPSASSPPSTVTPTRRFFRYDDIVVATVALCRDGMRTRVRIQGMSMTRSFVLGPLSFVLGAAVLCSTVSADSAPDILRSLRPSHPRLNVLDDDLPAIRQTIQSD